MADDKKSGKKTFPITLTKGGIALLNNTLPQNTWYKGLPLPEVFAAQEFQQCQLNPLASDLDEETGEDVLLETVSFDVDKKTYDGLNKHIKYCFDNGLLRLTAHTRTLAVELGILE